MENITKDITDERINEIENLLYSGNLKSESVAGVIVDLIARIRAQKTRIVELEAELAKVNCSVEKGYCANKELYLQAAANMYWPQVVLNGGPPCFHLEDGKRFCGRAERWAGHDSVHKFMSLADLLKGIV